MEEEVGFGLARSRLTAIPSCASRLCLSQNSPASARSRNPRKGWVLILTKRKIKTDQTNVCPFLLGGGGIRTHGTLARTTVFKTAPINRSGTPPKLFNWLP